MPRKSLYGSPKITRSVTLTEEAHSWFLEQAKAAKIPTLSEYLEKLARGEIKPLRERKVKPQYSDPEWNTAYQHSQQRWAELTAAIKANRKMAKKQSQKWYPYFKNFICMAVTGSTPLENDTKAEYLQSWTAEQLILRSQMCDLMAKVLNKSGDPIKFDIAKTLDDMYEHISKSKPLHPIDYTKIVKPL